MLERKRGRPPCRGIHSRRWLARVIRDIQRTEIDPAYLEALAARIESKSGITNHQRYRKKFPIRLLKDRDIVIRAIYGDMRKALVSKPSHVTFYPLGEMEVPTGLAPREQAAELTARYLRDKLGQHPPTLSQIIRIGSQ